MTDRGSRRWGRERLLSLVLVTLVAAHVVAGAPATATRAAASDPGPLPLHVDGRSFRDAAGREVVLHGIAVINKQPPYLPAVGPAEFARIRSWGLNSIRLGIQWRGIMPTSPAVDHGYVQRIRDMVDDATAAGLYVVLDMHQDVYGDPWGNGAPQWAFEPGLCPPLDLARLTGVWSFGYLNPQVMCALNRFWLGADLQSAYADAWRAVALAVGDNPLVVGYDLMNEPFNGTIPPVVFDTILYRAQAAWLAAIRTADPDGIGFIEPPVVKSLSIPVLPPLAPPPNSAYAPHLYGPWDAHPSLHGTRALADLNFAGSNIEAQLAGLPLWLGEWGVFQASPGATDFADHVFDLCDQAKASTSIWEFGDNAYGPADPVTGEPHDLMRAVQRIYPEAVPGVIDRFAYDMASRSFTIHWHQDAAGTAVIQVPTGLFPEGFVVTGSAGPGSHDPVSGRLHVDAAPGAHFLSVNAG